MDHLRVLRDRRRGAAHALLIAAALAACSPAPPAAEPPAAPTPLAPAPDPVAPGVILFVSEATGAPRAWRVDPDGQHAAPLPAVAAESWPAPADPLGQVALLVGGDGAGEEHRESLWSVPLAGEAAPTLLAPPAGRMRSPAWSPDGRWVYVESDRHGFGDVYRVPREGGEPGRLTDAPAGSFEPSVSSDGVRLAFGTSRDGNAEIYTLDVASGALARVTREPRDDVRPQWRPGADELVWLSHRTGRVVTWIGPASGARVRPLRPPAPVTNVAQGWPTDLDVALSPDGRLAAVTVQEAVGEVAIEIVDIAAGAVTARIDAPGVDEQPAFSPDSRWIVFSSARGGGPDLWLARADGSDPRPLYAGPGADWLPRWVPAPR